MKQPTIYIFINKSLKMNAGKVAAQASHAAALVSPGAKWKGYPERTIIVKECKNAEQITNIQKYLTERKIKSFLVIDEIVAGVPYQITALGVEVMEREKGWDLFFPLDLFHLPWYARFI